MAAFDYTALTADGATRRGVVEADSERHARRQLRDQHLTPLTLTASRRKAGAAAAGGLRIGAVRMSSEDLALFTRLLGTLLGSGLPLDDALTALARQADTKAVTRVSLGIRARVLEGQSLSSGMEEFPQVFSPAYRATVGAGERTRHLSLVLTRLADYVESRDRMQKRVRLAMVYPGVLTLTAVLVVAGLLTYVVPEVVKVFVDMERELPFLTRALITVSDFARDYGLLMVGAGAVLWAVARTVLRRPGPRFAAHSFLLRVPVLGRLIMFSEISRFSRMLAIMLGSSVDMLDALAIASKSVSLAPLQRHLVTVMDEVREGGALSRALGRSPLVPALLPHLVGNGESSGNLIDMLDTAAESFEFKVENTLSVLLSLIEPLLILAMGAIVLTIVIAILLPIFEMNQLV